MKRWACGALLGSLVIAAPATAAPAGGGYAILQAGGWVGLGAAGLGWRTASGRGAFEALYGYVPERYGGEIHTVALKTFYRPFRALPLTVGLTGLYGHHDELFVLLPEHYPDGYYPPTALHAVLNVGAEIALGRSLTVYWEAAWLDEMLIAGAHNMGTITWRDVTGYGFGLRYSL